MKNWMAMALVVLIITIALQVVMVYRDRFRRSERNIALMAKLFQWHTATHDNTDYDLYSFDNGDTWVAVTPKGIAGNASEVFGKHTKAVLDNSSKVSYQPKGWWQNHSRLVRNKADIAWQESKYDTKSGGGILTAGDYYLVSYDKRRNWVALGKDRQILGDVNKVNPGLLDRIKAVDTLCSMAMKQGPLDIKKPGVQNAFKRADFDVVKSK